LEERDIPKYEVGRAIREEIKSDAGDNARKAVLRNEIGLLVVIYSVKDLDEVKIITVYRQ